MGIENGRWSELDEVSADGDIPSGLAGGIGHRSTFGAGAPIASVDELAYPGVWESDEELDEFLDDLYASRRSSFS